MSSGKKSRAAGRLKIAHHGVRRSRTEWWVGRRKIQAESRFSGTAEIFADNHAKLARIQARHQETTALRNGPQPAAGPAAELVDGLGGLFVRGQEDDQLLGVRGEFEHLADTQSRIHHSCRRREPTVLRRLIALFCRHR